MTNIDPERSMARFLGDTGGENLSTALLEEISGGFETTWMSDSMPIVELRTASRKGHQFFVSVVPSGRSPIVIVESVYSHLPTGPKTKRQVELSAGDTTVGEIARLVEKIAAEREVRTGDVAGRVLLLARYKLRGGRFRAPVLVCASTERIARTAAAKHWGVVEGNVEVDEATEEEKGRHDFVILAPKRLVPIDDFFAAFGAIR